MTGSSDIALVSCGPWAHQPQWWCRDHSGKPNPEPVGGHRRAHPGRSPHRISSSANRLRAET